MAKPISKVPLVSALFLTACVTINIYFPAAAAEKAADRIIQEIQQPVSDPEPGAARPQGDASNFCCAWMEGAMAVLEWMVAPARAQQADLNVDSPAIRRIQATMRSRFNSLRPFYNQGYIGIASNGYLLVRDLSQIPLQDRATVRRLVDAENADRRNLYQAIAEANKQPAWRDQIEATFAKRWVANAERGWWYQAPNGAWQRK